MKIKVRCVLISFVLAFACYISYWLAMTASHSSLEQNKDGAFRKQRQHQQQQQQQQQLQSADEYEQNDERLYEESEPKKGDDHLAHFQQAAFRKSKENKAKFNNEHEKRFMGSRSDSGDDNQAENKQQMFETETDDDNDEEATIELSETHKQLKVNSVAGVPHYKNHLAQRKHIDFPEDVDEQNDVGIDEQQESSVKNDHAHHVQKSEADNEEDENEFVSLDELKADENLENVVEQLEPKDGKLTRKKTAETWTREVEVSKEKEPNTFDDMEEVDVREVELGSKSKLNEAVETHQDIGYPASHLRSHNIPPVPRIEQQSLANSLSRLSATKRPHIPVEEMDFTELPVQYESNQVYYLIHSGQASKVNRFVRVNPLPDYIPTDYYTFSSNRCFHVFSCLMNPRFF
jgi:hypothetical protein